MTGPMQRYALTPDRLDAAAIAATVESPTCGAVVISNHPSLRLGQANHQAPNHAYAALASDRNSTSASSATDGCRT